jgi:hypothetical protein
MFIAFRFTLISLTIVMRVTLPYYFLPGQNHSNHGGRKLFVSVDSEVNLTARRFEFINREAEFGLEGLMKMKGTVTGHCEEA